MHLRVCIYGKETAASAIAESKECLNILQNLFAYALVRIVLAHGETANLNGRIMVALLYEGNLPVDAVARLLVVLLKLDGIVEQGEISHDLAGLGVLQEIGDGQQLLLIVLGLLHKKFVQVAVFALELRDDRSLRCVSSEDKGGYALKLLIRFPCLGDFFG